MRIQKDVLVRVGTTVGIAIAVHCLLGGIICDMMHWPVGLWVTGLFVVPTIAGVVAYKLEITN